MAQRPLLAGHHYGLVMRLIYPFQVDQELGLEKTITAKQIPSWPKDKQNNLSLFEGQLTLSGFLSIRSSRNKKRGYSYGLIRGV